MTDFAFIQITDHHLGETEDELVRGFSPAFALRRVLAHIAEHAAHQADFILSTGDLVEPGTEKAYRSLISMLGLQGASNPPGPLRANVGRLRDFPIYFTPGNHDDRLNYLRCLFPQAPHPPISLVPPLVNTTFIHKGVQFICLDWGAEAKAFIYPETLAFLTSSLQTDLPTVIISHHHLLPVGVQWLDAYLADEVERFWEIIAKPVNRSKVIGIFCAHLHRTYETQFDGIPICGLRSTAWTFGYADEPLITLELPHYRLVSIQDGILTSRVFEVVL